MYAKGFSGKVKLRSRWEMFVNIYRVNGIDLQRPVTLPVYKAFLALFDTEMRDHCFYRGPMPFWDFSLDMEAPEKAEIWDSFGRDGCVSTPFLGTWMKGSECVRRNSIAFQTPKRYQLTTSAIQSLINSAWSYDTLKTALQKVTDIVLESIGGDLATEEWAARDPLYYLILRNIDRLWAMWQAKSAFNAKDYNGLNRFISTNEQATLDDDVYYLPYRLQVKDVLSIPSDGLVV